MKYFYIKGFKKTARWMIYSALFTDLPIKILYTVCTLLIYATLDGKFSPSTQISDLKKIQRARNNWKPKNTKKKKIHL